MPETTVYQDYSKRFAKQALAKHGKKATFTGQDLLSITESKQVNLLILWQLKDKWEVEKAGLTNPYFDYESEQVAAAMKNLMNALSQNIKIGRDVAADLVEAATLSALNLMNEPAAWVSAQMEKFANPAIDLGKIKELSKYITHHKPIVDSIAKESESTAVRQILKGDLTRMLYLDTPQLKSASEKLRAELEAILEIPKPAEEKPKKAAEEPPQPQNLFEQIEATLEEEIRIPDSVPDAFEPGLVESSAEMTVMEASEVPETLSENQIEDEEEELTFTAPPEPEPEHVADVIVDETLEPVSGKSKKEAEKKAPAPNVSSTKPDQVAENNEPANFYQKLQGHDSFYSTLKEKDIKKLSESISMGLKFRFINSLFSNDVSGYQAALDTLEKAVSGEKALDLLQNQFAQENNWNTDSDVYLELEKAVKRRFQA